MSSAGDESEADPRSNRSHSSPLGAIPRAATIFVDELLLVLRFIPQLLPRRDDGVEDRHIQGAGTLAGERVEGVLDTDSGRRRAQRSERSDVTGSAEIRLTSPAIASPCLPAPSLYLGPPR